MTDIDRERREEWFDKREDRMMTWRTEQLRREVAAKNTRAASYRPTCALAPRTVGKSLSARIDAVTGAVNSILDHQEDLLMDKEVQRLRAAVSKKQPAKPPGRR